MIDIKLYNERILDPALSEYRSAFFRLGYSKEETERFIINRSGKMTGSGYTAIPLLSPFCYAYCTMNCIHCAMMLPELKPFSTEFSLIKDWTDRILDRVDEVIRFVPASGEVLLYGELEKLLEYALNQSKILTVSITTNATVIPSENLIPLMKHNKFTLYISDYGNLSNQTSLIEFCEKNGIKTHLHELQQWVPVSYHKHNRTKEELISQFSNCVPGKICKTIYNGRLYYCGEMAAMAAAGLLKPSGDNSIEITSESCGDEYVRFAAREYSKACDMCGFGIENTPSIPSGEQKSGELCRSEYIIVSRKELAERRAWLEELTAGKNWLETQYFNYKALYEELLNEKTNKIF